MGPYQNFNVDKSRSVFCLSLKEIEQLQVEQKWVAIEDEVSESKDRESGAVFSYPWLDDDSRSKSHEALSALFPQFLEDLSQSISYSQPHWPLGSAQILLGSWGMAFCSIVADRLSILVAAKEKAGDLEVIPKPILMVPSSTLDFHLKSATSDSYNANIFFFLNQMLLNENRNTLDFWRELNVEQSKSQRRYLLKESLHGWETRMLSLICRFVSGRTSNSKERLALFQSGFSRLSTISLAWSLRDSHHVSVLASSRIPSSSTDAELRNQVAISLSTKLESSRDPLLAAIYGLAPFLLPSSLLESSRAMMVEASKKSHRYHNILTSSGHWFDDYFKFWSARQRESGARLIVSEHGGSLHTKEHVLEFERNLSDLYVPGSQLGTHKGPTQTLPIPKFVSARHERPPSSNQNRLTVITYEGAKWATRPASQPQSYRAFGLVTQLESLLSRLEKPILDRTTLKRPQKLLDWSLLSDRYKEMSKTGAVESRRPLQSELSRTRLAVCCYPETAFAEAIISGTPTILLTNPGVSVPHPSASIISERLREAKILFTCPIEAAKHINEVWPQVGEWWSDPAVEKTIEEFLFFLNLDRGVDLDKWSHFFRSEAINIHGK